MKTWPYFSMLGGYLGVKHSDAVREAKANGFTVIASTPTQLQVDWDAPTLDGFWERMSLALQLGLVSGVQADWRSKSGNYHILVDLPAKTSTTERLALQAMLGSDWKREMLNLRRYQDGETNPMVLFKP